MAFSDTCFTYNFLRALSSNLKYQVLKHIKENDIKTNKRKVVLIN